MAAKSVSEGDRVPFTPVADVAGGDVVVLGGSFLGVANTPIPAGVQGTVFVTGVFEVDKDAVAFAPGEAAYYDVATATLNKDNVNNPLFGLAIADAAAGDAAVRVLKLNAQP